MVKSIIFACIVSCNFLVSAVEIKLPSIPTLQEKTAAAELKYYMNKAVVDISIGNIMIREILIGNTDKAKEIPKTGNLQDEEWMIKAQNDKIIIVGGGSRGTLYGVYNFIENQLGVHWWNQFEEYIPAPRKIEIEKLDKSGRPFFRYREIYRAGNGQLPQDGGRFAIRNRLNADGAFNLIKPEFGGGIRFGSPGFVHTFNSYIPAAKYLTKNSEYFSKNKSGQRVGGQLKGQLCLTNPDVKKLIIKKLHQYIKEDIKKADKNGFSHPKIYDISINDNWYSCKCPKCRAAVAKENESGLLLSFLNNVAATIKNKYPDYQISTLAYYYTEPPPRTITPAKNIIIRFCNTTSNHVEPLSSLTNSAFVDKLKRWQSICDSIFIWDYAVTYIVTGMPFPSEFTYADNYKLLAKNNVRGIFLEHEHPYCADMYDMKLFLEIKLMENPYIDVENLKNTFIHLYYGPAANMIKNYREVLWKAANREHAFVGWMADSGSFEYLRVDELIQLQKKFDKTLNLLSSSDQNNIYVKRVKRARFGLDKMTYLLWRRWISKWINLGKKIKDFPLNRNEIIDRGKAAFMEGIKPLSNQTGLAALIKKETDLQKQLPNYVPDPMKFKSTNAKIYSADAFHFTKTFKIVNDSGSEAGFAARATVDGNLAKFTFPLLNGVYNKLKCTTVRNRLIEPKENPGTDKYKWYSLGIFDIDPKAYFFITNHWEVQLHFESTQGIKKGEIWVSMKLTGPAFNSSAKAGKSYLYIDRIVIVPSEK